MLIVSNNIELCKAIKGLFNLILLIATKSDVKKERNKKIKRKFYTVIHE
jgi:hypothetical protein